MLFDKLLLTLLAAGSAIAAPVLDRRQGSFYGSSPVRGVNIGGWLVLEPFITPSIFQPYGDDVVDEYTLCQNVQGAEGILRNHWDNWVSLADFQKIKDNGFNMVRIPVGYWAFQKYEQDTYIQGAADYLEKAIGWARQTGLKVWIDLHGAPRSQNGFDNSGQRMDNGQWTSTADSVSVTEDVIRIISQKYAGDSYSDVIVGIELLNEPLMVNLPGGRGATQQYYQNGFDIVRQNGGAMVVIQDGFVTPKEWNGFLTGSGNAGAIVDHHEYQVFTPADNALSPGQHIDAVWSRVQGWGTGQDKYVIAGEWAAAMTDCAYWLNGKGRGARYDGSFPSSSYVGSCEGKSGPISSWSQDWKDATRNYIENQRKAYEQYLQGWIVWNFKTEGAGDWSLLDLIDNGIWSPM